jgi:hypothetical protein
VPHNSLNTCGAYNSFRSRPGRSFDVKEMRMISDIERVIASGNTDCAPTQIRCRSSNTRNRNPALTEIILWGVPSNTSIALLMQFFALLRRLRKALVWIDVNLDIEKRGGNCRKGVVRIEQSNHRSRSDREFAYGFEADEQVGHAILRACEICI